LRCPRVPGQGRSIRSPLKGDGGNGERKVLHSGIQEQAVKMVVGLDCTYDLLHAL